jgi:hypothetical protein
VLETITMECGGALGVSGGGNMRSMEGDALGVCHMNILGSNSCERGAGNSDILVMGEDDGSNVPISGNDATISEGMSSTDILDVGDDDGMLHRDDCSDTPCGSGGLNVRILDDDMVTGGSLGIGYRSTCGLGKDVLATGDNSHGRGGGWGLTQVSYMVYSCERATW